MVTCGLADAEDASIACPHQCERRHLAAHEETCEFRAIECERCDARISARRARDHARVCPKRAERCDGCGVEIAASKMETHQKYHCGADNRCQCGPQLNRYDGCFSNDDCGADKACQLLSDGFAEASGSTSCAPRPDFRALCELQPTLFDVGE